MERMSSVQFEGRRGSEARKGSEQIEKQPDLLIQEFESQIAILKLQNQEIENKLFIVQKENI